MFVISLLMFCRGCYYDVTSSFLKQKKAGRVAPSNVNFCEIIAGKLLWICKGVSCRETWHNKVQNFTVRSLPVPVRTFYWSQLSDNLSKPLYYFFRKFWTTNSANFNRSKFGKKSDGFNFDFSRPLLEADCWSERKIRSFDRAGRVAPSNVNSSQ